MAAEAIVELMVGRHVEDLYPRTARRPGEVLLELYELEPGAATVVPLDIAVSFTNLPGLADVLLRAVAGGEIAYSLRGTATVDAGVLGRPTFGPMTLVAGDVELRR